MNADEICTARLRVKNTGNRSGSEVIQLYVREKGGAYLRASKELKDFAKVKLAPGEEKTVEFQISRKSLEVFSDTLHRWGVQSDDYEIIIARSCNEIIESAVISVHSADKMRELTRMSPLVKFVKCPAFHDYLKAHKPEWMQHFFNLAETDFLVLMLPLPFHRLSERVQGEPMFTKDEIDEIIRLCNKVA